MNNLFVLKHIVPAKYFAFATIVSLVLSAFPAHFFVANAATANLQLFAKPNPAGDDALGELVTLSILNAESLDFTGWKLLDNDDDETDLSPLGNQVGPVDIQICSNLDFATNGGVNCDLEFGSSFNLVNSDGSLRLTNGTDTVINLTWTTVADNQVVSKTGNYEVGDQDHKIDICHWSEGEQTFTKINVAKSSIGNAHGTEGSNDGDIIPPFDNYPGYNWDTKGQAIYENDCVVPVEEGSITIKKVAGGDTQTEFDFSGGLGDFTLVGGGEHVASDLKAGQYVITEISAQGWQLLDITCNDVQMNEGIPSVTIDLEQGEDVTCVFTNRPDQVEPPVCEIGENLLSNGSFEEPEVTDSKKWRYTAIIDWVITNLGGDPQDGELHRGWSGNEAADGEQYTELDSRESVKLSQTVDTIPGATYELKWAFAPRHNIPAGENQMSILVNGVEKETEGPATLPAGLSAGDWTRSSYVFVADTDETTVTFADAGDTSNSLGTFLDDAALCLVREPKEPEITVHTSKIVCTDEADLPNWGTGGPNITASTAVDWVNDPENPSCEIVEGWEFEWAPFGTSNPGDDLVGVAGGNWTTFTDSIIIPLSALHGKNKFWMREVLQNGYIPFSYEGAGNKNTNTNTAEFYCHTDVLNYDNYDRIDNLKEDAEYYCVGWNVPEKPPITYGSYCGDGKINQEWEQCDGGEGCTEQCQFEEQNSCTDLTLAKINILGVENRVGGTGDMTENLYVGQNSTPIPDNVWMAVYWNGSYFNDADIASYEDVPGLAVQRLGGQVRAVMHGSATGKDEEHSNGEVSFWSFDGSVVAESVSSDNSGNNKLEGDFTNGSGIGNTNASDDEISINADIAKFWITTTSADDGFYVDYGTPVVCEVCEDELNGGWADFVKASDQKKRKDGSDVNVERTDPNAALNEADWNEGGSTGFYSLGFGGSIEVGFDSFVPNVDGNDISIHEATNGNYPAETALVEVSQDGSTWYEIGIADNSALAGVTYLDISDAAVYLGWIKYVRVTDITNPELHQNSADGFDLDAVDATQTVCEIPDPETMVIDGHKFEYLGEGYEVVVGWLIELYETGEETVFATTTTDGNGYFKFEVPVGDYEVREEIPSGWQQLYVEQNGYQTEDSYCSFEYSREQYLAEEARTSNHVDNHEGSYYHCDFFNQQTYEPMYYVYGYKYLEDSEIGLPDWIIELRDNEGVLIATTTTDSNGRYDFDVPAGEYQIHEVMPEGWIQTFVEARNGVTTIELDINYCVLDVGGEYEDVEIYQYEGSYGCDFYNEEENGDTPPPPTITTTSRSGGSSGTRTNRPEPQVAGAAIQCPFLEDWMQIGWENDPLEVMKLQLFLNIFKSLFGGSDNPVTGVFGTTTDANVKAFQEHFRSEVLDPWYERGIVPHNRPTGFVYKTTLWKINDIICPEFAILPDFVGEDLTKNINEDRD